ncbi:hypothetical protein HWD99_11115 [Microbacterium sp. C5A9]|uniref:SCO7613 C-terminal domain-containing membrane protein n=1 Tax=Microbacterium sp. C5A9 TaxID=2736663 RepID=UPI001F526BE5|nr:hypothetical protein [Microbacterium sp. C5A9]MCI1019178.1 hypothetical protein [Microbacterium sp. C5A9]
MRAPVTASTSTGATTAPVTWGESVARHLLDERACPVCHAELHAGCCPRCGSDLRGTIGITVWESSLAAATALRARDALLRRIPIVSPASATSSAVASAVPSRTASSPPTPPVGGAARGGEVDPQGSATLQSVLATAGAGLFAVAAIVFTYFNPDLADRALRSVIVGLITLLFLGGAWLLSRRGLRFSAEAVGGLGLVFAGLDIHAFAQLAAPAVEPWLTSALATAVAGGVMLRGGVRRGIRIWQWTAVLAMALTPAMLGAAGGTPLAAALGAIGVAFAGAALIEWLRLPIVEVVTLTGVQLAASLTALVLVWRVGAADTLPYLLTVSALLVLIAAHAVIAARRMLAGLWAFVAGGVGSAALIIAVFALTGTDAFATAALFDGSAVFAVIPASAALALVLVGALVPLPRAVPRGFVAAGSLTVLTGPALLVLAPSAITGLSTVREFLRVNDEIGPVGMPGWGLPLGLLAMCAGLGVFSVLARRRDGIRRFANPTALLALCVGAVAVLVIGCGPLLVLPAAIAVLTGPVVLLAAALWILPTLLEGRGLRATALTAAHVAVVAAVMIAWRDPAVVPLAGAAALVALAALVAVLPAAWRFVYVAAGFGYALVLVATALGLAGVGGVAQLSLTVSAGLLAAIVATYLPSIGARAWQAVLVVSAVPFGIGILQVVVERSGWTALSTGLMFALALSLMLTRRPGLTLLVRTAAAAMLVPTLAVMIVCLGAQLLDSSGSPVVLPIIAVLVALVLPSTSMTRAALHGRGHSAATADAARVAIEASALVTGAIATALAVGREAAGLGTSFLVLLILGLGAAAQALFAGRRYAWGVAGAAFTGALWSVWGMAGVDVFEAYLLPPTLGAALTALLLTLRGHRATALYGAGLLVAIGPIVALVAVIEPEATQGSLVQGDVTWRVIGLLAAAWTLLALETAVRRSDGGPRMRRLRVLRIPTLLGAALAATVATVQGIRLGLGADQQTVHGAGLFLACLGVSAVGAVALALAAHGIRRAAAAGSALRTSRWLGAPAALALALGVWFAIERDWFSIWAMWALMIGYLVMVVVTASRLRRGDTVLPPVWFLFAIAFVTAVVAWSPRDLRVEWFSLPLGAFLLWAGVVVLRGADEGAVRDGHGAAGTLDSWPARWSGSWALLAPGLVTMMSASIVSTFTDPLTWRAILVMVLALAAILVGSRARLAAPFLIGLVVLPIENVFVFSVQIGRGIESMPWWITLAVMGAVLLIIAVTSERRAGESGSVAARIRDLR